MQEAESDEHTYCLQLWQSSEVLSCPWVLEDFIFEVLFLPCFRTGLETPLMDSNMYYMLWLSSTCNTRVMGKHGMSVCHVLGALSDWRTWAGWYFFRVIHWYKLRAQMMVPATFALMWIFHLLEISLPFLLDSCRQSGWRIVDFCE